MNSSAAPKRKIIRLHGSHPETVAKLIDQCTQTHIQSTHPSSAQSTNNTKRSYSKQNSTRNSTEFQVKRVLRHEDLLENTPAEEEIIQNLSEFEMTEQSENRLLQEENALRDYLKRSSKFQKESYSAGKNPFYDQQEAQKYLQATRTAYLDEKIRQNIREVVSEFLGPVVLDIDTKMLKLVQFQSRIGRELNKVQSNTQLYYENLESQIERLKDYVKAMNKMQDEKYDMNEWKVRKYKQTHDRAEQKQHQRTDYGVLFQSLHNQLEQNNRHYLQQLQQIKKKQQRLLQNIAHGLAKDRKCLCKDIIEQILRSQQHLMMEIKYIKHFNGVSKSRQKSKR